MLTLLPIAFQEKIAKLHTALVFVALPFVLLNLLGDLSWLGLAIQALAGLALFSTYLSISDTRWTFGVDWWRHGILEEDWRVFATNELDFERIAVRETTNLACIVGLWLLYQAIVADLTWMPSDYLYWLLFG